MSGSRRPGFVPRTIWSATELERDRQIAIGAFRRERLEESGAAYAAAFVRARGAVEALLTSTENLSRFVEQALDVLSVPAQLEVSRYLVGPPISLDDLKTLVDATALTERELRRNPALLGQLVDTIRAGLDRHRFPWVPAGREPTPAECETAVLTTAALMATQRVATNRRTEGKKAQEARVRDALLSSGLAEVAIPGLQIPTLNHAPRPGKFCLEVALSSRKADLVVGLWDGRIMPLECKVSNSAINSVKRLNNDAAVKAETWRNDLGATQVVPVAVLGGVYRLHNLGDAQERGLTLHWAHRLEDLVAWIARTAGR